MVHTAETTLTPDTNVTWPWQRCYRATLRVTWQCGGGPAQLAFGGDITGPSITFPCSPCPHAVTAIFPKTPCLLPPLRTCWACPSHLHWSFHPCRGSFSWGLLEGCCSSACCVSTRGDGGCQQPVVCTYLGKARSAGREREVPAQKPQME